MIRSWLKATSSKLRKDNVFSDEAGFDRFVDTQILTKEDAQEAIRALEVGVEESAKYVATITVHAAEHDLSIKKAAVMQHRSYKEVITNADDFAAVHQATGNVAFDMLEVNERTRDSYIDLFSKQSATFTNRIAFLERKFGLPASRPTETKPQGALESRL